MENLQYNLWKELEDVLLHENVIWAEKARAKWTLYGDQNTWYYHACANNRRKANRIEAIREDDGAWVYDVNQINIMATAFFAGLFKEEGVSRQELTSGNSFPYLEESQIRWCGREVSDCEIKDAIFQIGALKSPEPDG